MVQGFCITIAAFASISFGISPIAAASLERIDIDWSQVKPIADYPEFWERKSLKAPEDQFRNTKSYKNVESFVSNGNAAGRHDFPFKSALISEMPFGEALCGASLISREAVLTAASCIDDAANSIIILGGNDLSNPLEAYQVRFRVQSTNYRIHPLYRRDVTNSDVGIVKFNFSIHVFTQAVNVIQLPNEAMFTEAFANVDALSMGFGKYSDAAELYSFNLNYVQLSTMTNLACGLRFPGRIDTSHLCTTGLLRRGTCDGDVGAPLVIERAGISYQIGIASLFPGSGCATGEPSVFTRVTSFLPFIQQHM